jgi:DNA mismatch repair protein MutS2
MEIAERYESVDPTEGHLMDQHTLDILEFHRIRDILATYATSSLGKSLAASIQPETDIHRIEVWQKQITELKRVLGDGRMPLGGIRDIRPFLSELDDPASVLSCEALLDIHSTLQAARHIRDYLSELDDTYPNLSRLGRRVSEFRDIENVIFASVNTSGKIKNNATPRLNSIRKEIEVKRARIKSKLQSLVRSPRVAKHLQGGTVTIRKGRPVIPVKVRSRDNVPGIVRDRSDSGETLFIEPAAVSGAGDELQHLLNEEKQETFRILQEITERIRSKQDKVSLTLKMLSIVDLIHAKACFSKDFDMGEPSLNQDGRIDVKKARHPLLMYEKGWGKRPVEDLRKEDTENGAQDTGNPDPESSPDSVVAIDVRLGDDFDVLVVTGPNTGGKTVALKTVGLLSLMAQAGLHVPASSGSHLAVFRDVLADIGDEQSLQQNLSTFSSHLTQIVRILNQADHRALVLLDELGTGTDPQEGAALGTAIIDFLHRKGAKTIATTHLSALKTYAHAHPRIENAAVEFDMETLQPTYRLLIGAFGSSNALAIAQRLGLPGEVVSRASDLVEGEDARIEDLVNSLQQIKSQLEKERESLSAAREESLELKRHYEMMIQALQGKEKTLADLVPAGADGMAEEDAEPAPATFANLERGDTVKILSLNTVGEVIAKMRDKNKLVVRTNMMKVEVRPEDLEVVRSG